LQENVVLTALVLNANVVILL